MSRNVRHFDVFRRRGTGRVFFFNILDTGEAKPSPSLLPQQTARALGWTSQRHERFGDRRAQSMHRVPTCALDCVVATRRQRLAVGQLR